MTRIHYAKIEESERLQRVHRLLTNGGWHSTRDIMRAADVCAVNTVITELRCNGYDIVTRCAGKGRYEYQLITEPQRSLF
ncbi:MAG: helix-turn-helix domain-containing protein [Desulfuromonadales bacterium]|nr:helix-turn-helix domain-containing protein [Desulfuromonadales bacterium]